MLKKHVIGILAVAILALVLCSGCIQDEEIGVYPGSREIDVDAMIVSQYLGIPEDEIDGAISDLNIKAYGINGVSENTIIAWYENQHLNWALQKSETTNIFSLRAWSHWFAGHVVLVSDYEGLHNLVGYDTIFLTSHASLVTYDEYLNYLN